MACAVALALVRERQPSTPKKPGIIVRPTEIEYVLSIQKVIDKELVDRARRGDTVAFGELMDRHSQAVYRTALAAVGSPPDAEEIAQDSFVRAYRSLKGFREDASFRTWVTRIAWNLGLNRRRSVVRRVRRFVQSSDWSLSHFGSEAPSAESVLIGSERSQAAMNLIRALPAKLRDPLLLAATAEHSYAAIGAILGIPEGTVKWRVSEARKALRQGLNDGHQL